jgi:predicted ATPase
MIKSIQIQNFKSVVDLQLDLGSFNVLIGENGCGKSNILEGIAFGAAASADKLDFEFLGSRGIRLTNPEFMFSAFEISKAKKTINVNFVELAKDYNFQIKNNYKKWVSYEYESKIEERNKQIKELLLENDLVNSDNSKKNITNDGILLFRKLVTDFLLESKLQNSNDYISNFFVYSLEESKLRRFEDTNQIYPLGIKGEGLFQYLKELMKDEKNADIINEIKENLGLLDWYEDFALPNNMMQNEYGLSVKDRYLHENLSFFDQRSTNEGFLFLLFYATLFISKDTPQFFAIDNIDASFNPKLCMKLVRNLAALAKKHNKQVIVTTHNPAVLDGLNLNDDDQRLFVVRRNEEGHTKAKRVEHKAERTMKLSEVWTNGFIGGLPENF